MKTVLLGQYGSSNPTNRTIDRAGELNCIRSPSMTDYKHTKCTLILDLGDVLLYYSISSLADFSPSIIQSILISPIWHAVERGELDEPTALECIGADLDVSPDTLRQGLNQCRPSLSVDHEFLAQLMELKRKMGKNLEVYAMTNVSKNDYALMRKVITDWRLFDNVFLSFEAGMRKPELSFFRHVLDATGADPANTIFVDDAIDNVITARSLGIHSILFKPKTGGKDLLTQLHNRLFDPLERATRYMTMNAGKHISEIEGGQCFTDTFSQFLIFSCMQDASLLNLREPNADLAVESDPATLLLQTARVHNYFLDGPVGTTSSFPDDIDTTSCSLLAFTPADTGSTHAVLDKMLANRNKDGLMQTYLGSGSEARPRVDPIVLTNATRAFYKFERGKDVTNELAYIHNVLEHRAYIDGTLHYYSPESFLYFVSCLVCMPHSACDMQVQALRPMLAERLRERVGLHGDAVLGGDSLAVAMRVIACQALDVWCASDMAYLRTLQQLDGGFEIGWVCRYGRSRKRIGNRGVTTAYAIMALRNEAIEEGNPG